jgi:hypothetical protein
VFAAGVTLSMWDFFRHPPEPGPARDAEAVAPEPVPATT